MAQIFINASNSDSLLFTEFPQLLFNVLHESEDHCNHKAVVLIEMCRSYIKRSENSSP